MDNRPTRCLIMLGGIDNSQQCTGAFDHDGSHTTVHTPGPWYVTGSGDTGTVYGGKMSRLIVPFGTPNEPEDWANAKLIAAAPELLEGLKCLISADDEDCSVCGGTEDGCLPDCASGPGRAALRAAEAAA